jgi:hypothetical protein
LNKLRSAAVRFIVAAMARRPIQDYYVVIARRGDLWCWEVRRKSKPLGIKMTGDEFQSYSAAQFAGKRPPEDFLSDLSKEEKRK